jgi:hypothetical protein
MPSSSIKFDPDTRLYARFDVDAAHKDPHVQFFKSLKDAEKNKKTYCKAWASTKTGAIKSLQFLSIGLTMTGALNEMADNPNYLAALNYAKAGDIGGVKDALFELSVDMSIATGSEAPFYTINGASK